MYNEDWDNFVKMRERIREAEVKDAAEKEREYGHSILEEKMKQIGKATTDAMNSYDFSKRDIDDIAAVTILYGFQSWGQDPQIWWERLFDWLGIEKDNVRRRAIWEEYFIGCFPLGKLELEDAAVKKAILKLTKDKKLEVKISE